MSIGTLMVALPAAGLIWVWLQRLTNPALQDTYFVVANVERLVIYFAVAVGLFLSGWWLRNREAAK